LLTGRHKKRTDLGREFGATDVIAERGEEGITRGRELAGGEGTRTVLECVGPKQVLETAFGVVRDGGVRRCRQFSVTGVDHQTRPTLTATDTNPRSYRQEETGKPWPTNRAQPSK
jgi:threonine dehydrogenase-like Zn-dependent dehydrogenase